MPRPNTGPRLKWIEKRKSFYIVWYEAGRERVKATGTTDGGEAEAVLEEFIRDRRSRQRPSGPRDPREFPIADALDLYGRIHAPETKDPARIGCAISALLQFWGDNMVGDITKATCQRYVRERKRAAATVRRELGTLKAAVRFSHEEGHITHAPAVWMPEKPEGKDRWLTRGEAARLLNAARNARSDVRLYLPLFILIGLYAGARKEAILSLRWPQIDFDRGRINFARLTEQKTNKRRAHIPIPNHLMTFLRLAYLRRSSDVGFVIHDAGRPIKDIGGAWNGEVAAEGEQQYAQGSFGRACMRAGLPGVSPHTLRHTCGTWLAHARVSLFDIGQWLGHSDSRTTKLYAHHHPDFQEDARAALDRRKA